MQVSRILDNLDLIPKPHERPMPWMTGPSDAGSKRPQEEVRPIFWVKRAASYMSRTANWREFPNGRYGEIADPLLLKYEGAFAYAGTDGVMLVLPLMGN